MKPRRGRGANGTGSPRYVQHGMISPVALSRPLAAQATLLGAYAITARMEGNLEPSSNPSSAPRETPSTPMRLESISGCDRNHSIPLSKYSRGTRLSHEGNGAIPKYASAKVANPWRESTAALSMSNPPPDPLSIITTGCGPAPDGMKSRPT